MNTTTKQKLIAAALLALLCFSGCGSDSSGTTQTDSQLYLSAISQIYYQYQTANRGKLPKDEAEFKQFANEWGKSAYEGLGLESADELFTSARDGQPITLLFGKDIVTYEGENVLAYEQTPLDGNILVATQGGASSAIPEAEFNKIKK